MSHCPKRPTSTQMKQAIEPALSHKPESESWGLYSYSDLPPCMCGSGMGAFFWFATKAEMLHFMREYHAWMSIDFSAADPAAFVAQVQAAVDSVGPDPDEERLALLQRHLNKLAKHLWQIEWWGRFDDLCRGETPFARKVRERFWECWEEDGGISDSRPIPHRFLPAFREYLREYGI